MLNCIIVSIFTETLIYRFLWLPLVQLSIVWYSNWICFLSDIIENGNSHVIIHCGLMIPYSVQDSDQYGFSWWIVVWWHQAIALTTVDISTKEPKEFSINFSVTIVIIIKILWMKIIPFMMAHIIPSGHQDKMPNLAFVLKIPMIQFLCWIFWARYCKICRRYCWALNCCGYMISMLWFMCKGF